MKYKCPTLTLSDIKAIMIANGWYEAGSSGDHFYFKKEGINFKFCVTQRHIDQNRVLNDFKKLNIIPDVKLARKYRKKVAAK